MTAATSTEPGAAAAARGDRTLLEIQALRAIAVGLVVVYHVWPTVLPGGFVGVDVFFVISGFLITAHLLREQEAKGRISLRHFWARRIRRLLPAAFTVLAVCVVLAFTVLPDVFRVATLRQIAGAAGYVLNWVLAYDAVDYLAHDDTATVVQHYWTLSVEEQFYIVWPILLVIVLWIVARLRRRAVASMVVLWAAVAIGAVSFAFSVFLTWYSPAVAYFATPTRVWEFAGGALLAAIWARFPAVVDRARAHWIVERAALPTLAGIALMVLAGFVLSSQTPFPGWRAALPVVGAMLMIAGGMPRLPVLAPIIRARPTQFLGDVSYSIYLWHWPLIVTVTTLTGHALGAVEGLLVIASSIVLAALTYRFVETPGRSSRSFLARLVPAFGFALVGILAFGGVYGAANAVATQQAEERRATWEARLADPGGCTGANALLGTAECSDPFTLGADVDLAAAAQDLDRNGWCLTWYDVDWVSCEIGDTDSPDRTIALVGDSHGAALVSAFDRFFADHGIRVITYLRFGCSALEIGSDGFGDTAEDAQERDCRVWSQRVRDELAQRDDIDAVVFTNFTSAQAADPRGPRYSLSTDDIVTSWRDVLATGKRVIALRDLPLTGPVGALVDVPSCLANKVGQVGPCSFARAEALLPDPMRDAAERLADDDVTYLDLSDAYCDDTRCYGVIGDTVVYADNNHISGSYALSLMNYLGPQLLAAIER